MVDDISLSAFYSTHLVLMYKVGTFLNHHFIIEKTETHREIRLISNL